MLHQFNLIDEPWIPCLLVDGSQVELSLHDALGRANEVLAVAGESPPIAAALYRLLIAVLHCCAGAGGATGPRNADAWEDLWQQGRFAPAALDDYLGRWQDRFDLFGEAYPFYQTTSAAVEPGKAVSVAKLLLQSDNNPTLFDHTIVAEPPRVSPAYAARLVVAYQAFDTAGLITGTGAEKSAKASPLLQCAVVVVRGANLFQTLMLNLYRYNAENGVPWDFAAADDRPAWERDAQTQPDDRMPAGYLDLLTWQSRRIRLWPEDGPDGRAVVRRATVMKGFQIADTWSRAERETMVAFIKRLKPLPGQEPWAPLGFQEDRALWRDSLVLLQSFAERSARPRMIGWLASLWSQGVLGRVPLALDAFGLSADRAKLLFWRHERLDLPLPYLDEGEAGGYLRQALGEALGLAEAVGRTLGSRPVELRIGEKMVVVPSPIRRLAQGLLGENAPANKGDDLIRHLAPARTYWALLDEPFRRLLAALPDDVVEEDGRFVYGLGMLPAWRTSLRRAALTAFRQATEGLEQAGRTMRAVSLADHELHRQLRTLLPAMPAIAEPLEREGSPV